MRINIEFYRSKPAPRFAAFLNQKNVGLHTFYEMV